MEEKKILAIQFGLDCLQMAHDFLKDEQRKAILIVLEENYFFIFLPTGYGKSLCFRFSHLLLNTIEDVRTFHQYLLRSVHQLYKLFHHC